MDAVVQFLRNLGSCVKDLNLWKERFPILYDPSITALFFTLPEPMDQTTPLEIFLSLTQFYAFYYTTQSGWTLITTSLGKLHRIRRLVDTRDKPTTVQDRIVNESLLKEANMAIRSIFIGTLVTPIGICFWWIFINSFHLTEVDWFGGLPALIHAIEIMELALIPLLYYMIVDGRMMLYRSRKAQELVTLIQEAAGPLKPADICIQTYESMTGWIPFWDGGVGLLEPTPDPMYEQKLMDKEVEKVQKILSTFLPPPPSTDKKDKNKKNGSKGEKEEKIRKQALAEVQEKLQADVPVLRMEGYREFVYFVLNFFAFYGYLMAPLAFYWEDETQPDYIRSLKFSYNGTDADWIGNFTGDLMWTIEPVIILASPFLVSWIKKPKMVEPVSSKKKKKAD
jgi:hypothetical protein